jgi:hypothetical protein
MRTMKPLDFFNVEKVASWSGFAVEIDSAQPANLKYRDVEQGGFANINCRRGTVRFWFRPSWSSGTGPGNVGRLIEMADNTPQGGWWALSVNAAGTEILFQSQMNRTTTTYFNHTINWTAGDWRQIALTYDPDFTRLYIDGALAAYEGAYRLYLQGEQPRQAAISALGLSVSLFLRGDVEVGSGWMSRAHRLLRDEPEGPEHGYLSYLDLEAALDALAAANREYEERFGHIFLVCATGRSSRGTNGTVASRPQEAQVMVAPGFSRAVEPLRSRRRLALQVGQRCGWFNRPFSR